MGQLITYHTGQTPPPVCPTTETPSTSTPVRPSDPSANSISINTAAHELVSLEKSTAGPINESSDPDEKDISNGEEGDRSVAAAEVPAISPLSRARMVLIAFGMMLTYFLGVSRLLRWRQSD